MNTSETSNPDTKKRSFTTCGDSIIAKAGKEDELVFKFNVLYNEDKRNQDIEAGDVMNVL